RHRGRHREDLPWADHAPAAKKTETGGDAGCQTPRTPTAPRRCGATAVARREPLARAPPPPRSCAPSPEVCAMRAASWTRWATCALALSICVPVALADRGKKSISSCTSFDQEDKGEDRV